MDTEPNGIHARMHAAENNITELWKKYDDTEHAGTRLCTLNQQRLDQMEKKQDIIERKLDSRSITIYKAVGAAAVILFILSQLVKLI